MLERAGFTVRVTPNVYPGMDELDIVPARGVIHDAFEEHIIHAPGMGRISELVAGHILPTPGAVLIAAETLAEDARRPGRRRRRWRDDRRALGHRWQPRDRGAAHRAAAAQRTHGRRRPRHVRQRPSTWWS